MTESPPSLSAIQKLAAHHDLGAFDSGEPELNRFLERFAWPSQTADAGGAGLGRAFLKDALRRTAAAADIAGIRALVVHAKGEPARRWYAQFDFDPSPTDLLHLFLLIKDIKRLLSQA